LVATDNIRERFTKVEYTDIAVTALDDSTAALVVTRSR